MFSQKRNNAHTAYHTDVPLPPPWKRKFVVSTPTGWFARTSRVAAVLVLLALPLFFLTRVSTPAYALPADNLNFQARLQTAAGAIAADGNYNLEFKVYNVDTGGTALWTETRTGANRVRVANGYLTVNLGEITSFPANMPWDQQLYLTMNVGGTTLTPTWDGEMNPRLKLTAVPYAMRAKQADSIATSNGSFNSTLTIQAPTGGNQSFVIQDQGAAGTYNLLTENEITAGFIQLQATTPGTAQTGNFNISGTGMAGVLQASTALQTPTLDTATATVLNIGTTNATQVQVGSGTTDATAKLFILDSYNNGTDPVGYNGAMYYNTNLNKFRCYQNGAWADCEGAGGGGANTALSNIASTNLSAALNVTSGDLNLTTTTSGNIVLDGAGTINLQDIVNINAGAVVGANQTISFTGGTTASRPGSPTEGMVYFDTDTKQLLTYANGKWQADRGDAVLVAANNSSAADKAAADYVADGNTGAALDGDQVQINQALTAGAGKRVVLLAGTYTVDASVSVPNDTMLTGVGQGTKIELADIDITDHVIENSDTTTGTGITIRDMRLDGRDDLNTAGWQNGIYLNNMGDGSGATATRGAEISGVTFTGFRNAGITTDSSNNNVFSNNHFIDNYFYGLYLDTLSDGNLVTNNSFQGNDIAIEMNAADRNTISGNSLSGPESIGLFIAGDSTANLITGNTIGTNGAWAVLIQSSHFNTVSDNTFQNNPGTSIYVQSSNDTTVSRNKVVDSGGSSYNDGIYLYQSDRTYITDNTITDTSATANNYAINVSSGASDDTYLSGNVFYSTPGTSTINDAGTGTVYAGQSMAENGQNIRFKQAASTAAVTIQNANGVNVTNVDTTNGELEIGNYNGGVNAVGGKIVFATTTNANTVTLASAAQTNGSYTLSIPNLTGNDTICTVTQNNCPGTGANTTLSNLTSPTNINQALNTTSGNLTLTTTTSGNIVLNSAGTIELQDNTNVTGNVAITGSLSLAANQTISFTGGTTASRPGSPTEGMVYYDTDTKQLLTYANGKWQADRSDAVLVAANNSSAADKAAADYVADGTGDQVEINAALTAAAGKKVVLLAGTYSANATILVPNNTTFSGVGNGTLIQLADIDATDNLIENSDTSTGTGVVIRDLKLDGQRSLNTAGTQYGISFNGMGNGSGAGARQGGEISGVTVINFRDSGIQLSDSDNNKVANNTIQGSGWNGFEISTSTNNAFTSNNSQGNGSVGFYLTQSSSNTLYGNTAQGNGTEGFLIVSSSSNNALAGNTAQGNATTGFVVSASSSGNTVSGNTAQANEWDGFNIMSSSNNTLTGNTSVGNLDNGIRLDTSTNNIISNNSIHDNNGSTANDGIYLNASDANSIVSNTITDTSCTTTCRAIDITNSTSDNNYISGNTFSTTSGTAVIRDLGSGTIYAGQAMTAGGLDIRFKQAASTAAVTIQNANGVNVTNVDTTNGELELGNYNGGVNAVGGKIVFATTTNANTVTLASAAQTNGSYTLSIPNLTGNDTICTVTQNNCVGTGANTTLSNLTSPTNINQALNTTSGNLTLTTTTSGNIVLNSAGTIELQDNTNVTGNVQASGQVAVGGNANLKLYSPQAGYVAIDSGGGAVQIQNDGDVDVTSGNLTVNADFGDGGGTNIILENSFVGAGSIDEVNVINFNFNAQQGASIVAGKDGDFTSGASRDGYLTFNTRLDGSMYERLHIGSEGNIVIGASNTTGSLLILDDKTDAGDPAGVNGGMYYNSNSGKFRCYQAGGWADCIGSGGGGGANTSLSNLSGVAINTSLISDTNNTDDLGSAGTTFRSGYFGTSVSVGTASIQGDMILQSGGGFTTTLRAGASAANLTFTLPTADGSNLNCLKTNGSGQLNFSNCNNGSGSGGAVTLNDAYTAGNTITTTNTRDINFTFADTAVDSSMVFNLQCATCSASGGRFAVQNGGTDVFTVNPNNGGVLTKVNSTTAFVVQNTSALDHLTVNTSASKVTVGNESTDASAVLFLLDSYNNGTDPGGFNGAMYYNTNLNKFRCYQNGAWADCIGSGGGGGANTALSNLAAVAINTTLISDTTNTDDLGSAAITWRTGYFGTSVISPLLDTASAVALDIGTTNATVINLKEDTVVAAGKNIRLVGGNTASRPASPTEGMVYYDTDTKQLLTYANGKWQADRSDAILVAASDSSARDKAAADYIADGTGDQTEINSALTAASGKKVVLLAGTYSANATILIPNNTTLAGIGAGTLVQLADLDADENLIENSDSTTGTGVTIQNLKLDGQSSLNTAGTQHGISLNSMGSGTGTSARQGAKLTNIWVNNFRTYGIFLNSSSNNTVTSNTAQGNTDGINLYLSSNNTVTGNTAQGNTNGIYLNSSSNNTVTGNTAQGNTNGIYLNSSSNNTVTGNTAQGNGSIGIYLNSSSNNTVTSNKLHDSGGANANNGIFLSASDSNTITSNDITDTSCGTGAANCFAINILNSTSDTNYLAGNRFSDTDVDATSTINDAGTGTVYANQPLAENGGSLTNRNANSTASFQIQNATGAALLTANTSSGEVLLGTAGSLGGRLALSGSTSGTVSLSSAATVTSYNLVLPSAAPSTGQCLKAGAVTPTNLEWGSCGGGGGGSSRQVILSPEFAGGTLQADGSNNAGVMNADFVSGLSGAQGYKHNYYQWTSSASTAQDYNIIVNTPIPSEYVSNLNNLRIWTYSSNTSQATATVQFADEDGTTCYGSPVSITPSTTNTWQQIAVGSMSGCTFSANNIVTISITVVASNNEVMRIGRVSFEYTN